LGEQKVFKSRFSHDLSSILTKNQDSETQPDGFPRLRVAELNPTNISLYQPLPTGCHPEDHRQG
jgi:hypothetical protein